MHEPERTKRTSKALLLSTITEKVIFAHALMVIVYRILAVEGAMKI